MTKETEYYITDTEFMEELSCYAFRHEGYVCVLKRVCHSLTLNGYVGIPSTHRLFGTPYHELMVDVHGGLTYSYKSLIDFDNLLPDLWWFGFDTNHLHDKAPLSLFPPRANDGVYRNMGYVIQGTKSLAEQLKKLEHTT